VRIGMKVRVTISVEKTLLEAAERRGRGRTRSEIFEEALRAAERLARATETIAYYRSLAPEDVAEEQAWGELAGLGAAAIASDARPSRKP
jgi:hypothetical protein